MSEFLFQYYPVHPTTWVYLSSLLMVGVFFKFSRFWSVRNVDLVLLILLAPGLLMVHFGELRAAAAKRGPQIADGELVGEQLPPVASASEQTASDDAKSISEASDTESVDESNSSIDGASFGEDLSFGASQPAPSEGDPEVSTPEHTAEEESKLLSGDSISFVGYVWLLSVLGVFMIRMLLDPAMVRRPLLEPNLSTGGLTFIGCSLFVFLMANVVKSPATDADLSGARGAEQLLAGVADGDLTVDLARHGPGNALLHSIPSLVTTPLHWQDTTPTKASYVRTAKAMAIMSHLAVVFGIVAIGYQHFGSIKAGIGSATLYLMLPYTSLMTGRVDHVLPAALLVWAVLCYRRPLAAGSFIGLAIGVAYYPLFLLPLWISFYWQRGLKRFNAGVVITIMVSVLSLLFVSNGFDDFVGNVQRMFGIWLPRTTALGGIWGLGWDPTYRFPVIAAFSAIAVSFALWPAQKNLGTLLSCSGAIMIATQFWHGDGGGTYMAWFLPLTLLTIFRPNLDDRVALSVLGESWFRGRGVHLRRDRSRRVDRAA